LFEDNLCIADTDTDEDEFPIEVRIHRVKNQQVKIRPEPDSYTSESEVISTLQDEDTTLWFYDLLNPVPYERRIHAIRQVKQNQQKKSVLTGQRPVGFSVNKYDPVESEINLNDHQRVALVWAKGANDVVCIHGPPGTGKTRTLTAYALDAVSRGKRVLVTAHSNQAVDNLLVGESTIEQPEEDTLHAFVQDFESNVSVARAGNNSRNPVVQSNYMGGSIGHADIVAATTNGAAKFDSNDFDVAIVDEATQASRPATAIALNAAQKLILAGDHKQLPPFCADETSQEEDMHISLFEHLLNRYDERISVMLQKQYRMNEKIAEFPNQEFYNNNLITANQNQDWTVSDLSPVIGIDIDGQERRETHGQSYYNIPEAEAVAKQVKLLIQSGLSPENIGVITAYSGQVGQIGSRVNQLDIYNPKKINIDTVDSFQGGERKAIIVSFVRSNSDGHSGFLEFPEEGPRRLNVAITRAKKRLVLVGDWNTLGQIAPHRTKKNSCAPLYDELEYFLRDNDFMISN
jgi:superfamily I DNA and/or RNA helicase